LTDSTTRAMIYQQGAVAKILVFGGAAVKYAALVGRW
jgi:hypothetical protein